MGILDRFFGTHPTNAPATVPVAAIKTRIAATPPPKEDETGQAPAAAPPVVSEPPWGDHLQKRLDTYFARLRLDFPDGNVVRLNTRHKKLAERGAELRRLIGYEGDLDGFFALGGFTYQRTRGGRPPLAGGQTDSVDERLRALFPEKPPSLTAVQQRDHRLYLDLRAAARKADCTVGEYLKKVKENYYE